MAVPKRKTSKSVRNKRRTHKKIAGLTISSCPNCSEPKLPHRICSECGAYKGKSIINADKK